MKDSPTLRTEIAHLRTLAAGITDPQTLAAIAEFIHELELRLHRGGNGVADAW
jgi:hypothetical protein